MKKSEIYKDIAQNEELLGLYDYKIFNFSVWRIVRFNIVREFVFKKYSIQKGDTLIKRVKLYQTIYNYLSSLFSIFLLCINKNKQNHFIVFGFPRLQQFENVYFDKFTDPVIQFSNLNNNTIIFQRHLAGGHKKPRLNSDKIIKTDFIDYTSTIFSLFLTPFIYIFNYKKVNELFNKLLSYFNTDSKVKLQIIFKFSSFLISYYLYKIIFKLLSVKAILYVDREIYLPVTATSKALNIPVYEFQHGITHSWTLLYSTKYDFNFDPDLYLSFGDKWNGKQFAIPTSKIVNIGYAYRKMIEEKSLSVEILPSKYILVVSEPQNSDAIIHSTIELAKRYNNYIFHIRPHPQEGITDSAKEYIESFRNIEIVSNRVESTLALIPYTNIVGLHTSVLYEALSLNKNVGLLNFGKTKSNIPKEEYGDSFYFINSIDDLNNYVERSFNQLKKTNLLYSEFNIDLFNSILEQKSS